MSTHHEETATWRIAIDVGGTFTDAVAISDVGGRVVTKVPSTPDDPAEGVLKAIRELGLSGVPLSRVMVVAHGTTVATNAVITGRMARVILLTTRGFKDILSYRSGSRPDVYDLRQQRPDEFVNSQDRIEVDERLTARGDVIVELTDAEIDRVVSEVVDRGPDAVAICLLFSYVDDSHERSIVDRLRSVLPDLPVTSSSEIAREFREYPRMVTTVVNAGLRPIVGRYLLDAKREIAELDTPGRMLVMQSNGGSVPAERAEAESHRLLLSGPAAGVAGTVSLGIAYGIEQLISLDMGGTSVDVCLIRDGIPPVTPVHHLGPHPILAPSVDIFTAGAGGGSIVEVDGTGRLQVGPRSAGADPGPVAYGRGGSEPTLTDAHLVAGSLGSQTALGGRLRLDPVRAYEAIAAIAQAMALGVEETAEGVIALATAHLEGAIRTVSIERGEDPRGYTLVAFGGAGPLHAGQLLRDMELPAAVIPRQPGLFSAEGLLTSDLRADDSKTVLRLLDDDAVAHLTSWLKQSSARLIDQLVRDGIDRSQISILRSIDCRYVGQGYELNVPLVESGALGMKELTERFHEMHLSVYGHVAIGDPVEAVTLRTSAFGRWNTDLIEAGSSRRPEVVAPDASALLGYREVGFRGHASRLRTPVFARERLSPGTMISGPGIVEQLDSTTLVLPGQTATVDPLLSMWLREDAGDVA